MFGMFEWNRVDYARPVRYKETRVRRLYAPYRSTFHFRQISGIYLLSENGSFYIGESLDIVKRLISHRTKPSLRVKPWPGFRNPTNILLGELDLDWEKNNLHILKVAERRFFAACLILGVELVNRQGMGRGSVPLPKFQDLSFEIARVQKAITL